MRQPRGLSGDSAQEIYRGRCRDATHGDSPMPEASDSTSIMPDDAPDRRVRKAVRILCFTVCVLLGACIATPTTFVLEEPHRFERFETYAIRFTPIADDTEFDGGLRQS